MLDGVLDGVLGVRESWVLDTKVIVYATRGGTRGCGGATKRVGSAAVPPWWTPGRVVRPPKSPIKAEGRAG